MPLETTELLLSNYLSQKTIWLLKLPVHFQSIADRTFYKKQKETEEQCDLQCFSRLWEFFPRKNISVYKSLYIVPGIVTETLKSNHRQFGLLD